MRDSLRKALTETTEQRIYNARLKAGHPVLSRSMAAALVPYGKRVGGDDPGKGRWLSIARKFPEPKVIPLRVLLIEGEDYYADRIHEGLVAEGHAVRWIVGENGQTYSPFGDTLEGMLATSTGGVPDTFSVRASDYDVALVSDDLRGQRSLTEVVGWLRSHNVFCIGLSQNGDLDTVDAGCATAIAKDVMLGSLSQPDYFRTLVSIMALSAGTQEDLVE